MMEDNNEFGGKRKIHNSKGELVDQSWGRVQTPDLKMSSADKLDYYFEKKKKNKLKKS